MIRNFASSNSRTVIDKLKSLETELGLVRDKLGTDQKMTKVPLRSAWEGIPFVYRLLQDVMLRTVPLLQRKDTALTSSQVKKLINSFLVLIIPSYLQLQTRVEDLEQICIARFIKYDKLFTLCSGGRTRPVGQALSSHLSHLVSRMSRYK